MSFDIEVMIVHMLCQLNYAHTLAIILYYLNNRSHRFKFKAYIIKYSINYL